MKTEKFKLLCRKFLVPIISDAIHGELKELEETIDAMAGALARIEEQLRDMGAADPDEE